MTSTRKQDSSSRRPHGTPSYDDIARRAYELFLERGGESGRDADDWLRAESELTAVRAAPPPRKARATRKKA